MEKIADRKKLIELKQESIRKLFGQAHGETSPISRLWKDVEDQLELVKNSWIKHGQEMESVKKEHEECNKELAMKKDELGTIQKSIEQKNEELKSNEKKLGLVKMELEECCNEIFAKNNQLLSLQESLQVHYKKLELKEKEVEDVKSSAASSDFEIETKKKELSMKRNQLAEVERLTEDRLGELKSEDLKLLSAKENLRSLANELTVKKEHLESVKKELEVKEKEAQKVKNCARSCHVEYELKQKGLAMVKGLISDCNDELALKQKQFEKLQGLIGVCSNELDLKEGKLSGTEILIRQCQDELDLKRKELDATQRMIQKCSKELDWKQKQLTEVQERVKESSIVPSSKEKRLDSVNDLIDEDSEILKAKQKQCDVINSEINNFPELPHDVLAALELSQDPELKEKLIQKWAEEVELVKNKYLELYKEAELKRKQVEYNQGCIASIDGKALQIHLNEHSAELGSMRIVVSMALGHSSNPSMLVLDALQGFYPPHLKKGDNMEFEGGIVWRSCSLLLEELMKLSPEIRPRVKREAGRIANDWMGKLTTDAEHSLEVLCFLQLLASYGLASVVDADQILTMLEIVKHHGPAPALFRALGFTNKVSDVIRTFIKEKKINEAIRFIYAFEMVGQFQPVSLLDKFLGTSKLETKRLRKINQTCEGQINASNKRLADIKCVLRCIEEFKIDHGPSRNNLEIHVRTLEKEISKWKEAALRNQRSKDEEKHLAPVVDTYVVVPVAESTTSASIARPQQLSGIKRPLEDVISKECRASTKILKKEISEGNAAATATSLSVGTTSVQDSTIQPQCRGNQYHQPKKNSLSVDPSKEGPKKLPDVCEKNQIEDGEIAAAL